AVEGETFTAGIAAEICGLDERVLVRRLSREVEKQHRLVDAEGLAWRDGRRLARYRFRHQLFQQYLYQELADAERVCLHEAVGLKLEALAEDTRAQAAELAWHFDQAGRYEKALAYLLQAGDAARLLYATEEAVAHYKRALAILTERGDYEEAARVLMKLGLTYTNAFDFEGARQAYDESFALKGRGTASPAVKSQDRARQTLRIASLPVPNSLDLIVDGVADYGLFPGLVRVSSDLDIVPAAARSWEILNNGRTYLFHLREDIYWSDGRQVTAGDFVYAWRRTLDPEHGSPYAELLYDITGAADYHQGHKVRDGVLGFKALDDRTLKVELAEPVAFFLQLMGDPVANAVPRHVIEAYGEAWTDPENIVSSGPFRLHTRDEAMMAFIRDPGFCEQLEGNVERVEVHFNESHTDCLRQYAANEVDICPGILSDALDFREVMQQYTGEIWNGATLVTGYYVFDVSRPPFDDSRVRRAFAMATDRRQLATALGVEQDSPATGGFVPPGIFGHVPDIALPFDLDRARELLAEAGYPEGKGLPPLSAIVLPVEAQRFPKYALKCWEDELGVRITWREAAESEYFETIQSERPHIYNLAWSADYPDPDNFLRVAVHKETPWRHKKYESLISEARVLGDNSSRLELYRMAEEILVQEAPLVPYYYFGVRSMVKPWVKTPHNYIRPQWYKMIIEPHEEAGRLAEKPRIEPSSELKPVLRLGCLAGDLGSGLDPINPGYWNLGLFPGLVQLTSDLDVVPDVAQSWEIQDNGTTYLFHLREDVLWNDGVPVTAHDFVYAWRRMLDPYNGPIHSRLFDDIHGTADYHQGRLDSTDGLGFEALDDFTLEIKLRQPAAYFLQVLCNDVAAAVPRHVIERSGKQWAEPDHIATCGPYEVKSQDEELLVLHRSSSYHGRLEGNVKQIEYRSYPSLRQRLSAYSKDMLDVLGWVSPELCESSEFDPSFWEEYRSGPHYQNEIVCFDVEQPPFDDLRVRRAFVLAIDRRRIAEGFKPIHDTPATGGLVPSGLPGHVPDIGLPFDPDGARRSLAEAGYPGGRGFPSIRIILQQYNAHLLPEHLLLPWQDILGVNIDHEVVRWNDFHKVASQRRPQIELPGWTADYPDPDNFLRVCVNVVTKWRHQAYEALIAEARGSLDHGYRLELFRQAEEILVREAPIAPLVYLNYHVFVKPWVKHYVHDTIFKPQWDKVIIEPH
ncbi:MAG: ABC transporter substrate-binding protein, partial [Candidatus Promineifilaceae bacterium]